MLADQPLIAFLATADATRCRAFFEQVLGLQFVAEEPYALIFQAASRMLRIAILSEHRPASYTALGWMVADIAATVQALARRGVVFQRYEGFIQDEMGVCAFPDGTRVAWFQDPDGNTLSLTEFPTSGGGHPH